MYMYSTFIQMYIFGMNMQLAHMACGRNNQVHFGH